MVFVDLGTGLVKRWPCAISNQCHSSDIGLSFSDLLSLISLPSAPSLPPVFPPSLTPPFSNVLSCLCLWSVSGPLCLSASHCALGKAEGRAKPSLAST